MVVYIPVQTVGSRSNLSNGKRGSVGCKYGFSRSYRVILPKHQFVDSFQKVGWRKIREAEGEGELVILWAPPPPPFKNQGKGKAGVIFKPIYIHIIAIWRNLRGNCIKNRRKKFQGLVHYFWLKPEKFLLESHIFNNCFNNQIRGF